MPEVSNVIVDYFQRKEFDHDAVVKLLRLAMSQSDELATDLYFTAWKKFVSPYVHSDIAIYEEQIVDISAQILLMDNQDRISDLLFKEQCHDVKCVFEHAPTIELTGIVTYRLFSSGSKLLDDHGHLRFAEPHSISFYSKYLFLAVLLRRMLKCATLENKNGGSELVKISLQRLTGQSIPTLIYVAMKGELRSCRDVLTNLHIGDSLMY